MSYTFYPGCSLDGTAKDFHRLDAGGGGRAGAGAARDARTGSAAARRPPTAAIRCWPTRCRPEPARGRAARPVAVACAACYSRLKMANHHIAGDAAVRAKVAEVVGGDYDGLTPGAAPAGDPGPGHAGERHRRRDQPAAHRAQGGLLLRLPAVAPAGGHAVRRRREPHAHGQAPGDRRGHGRGLAAQDRVLRRQLLHHRLEHRPRAQRPDPVDGAGRRRGLHRHRLPAVPAQPGHAAEGHRGQVRRRYNLPVFYFTQLLGLALGCSASELSLDSLVVDPRELLRSKGLLGNEAER